MKLRIISIIVLFGFYFHGTAYGNWEKISGSLYESQAHAIQIDPFNSQTIYLGVKGSLYRTTDGGERWKKILKLESITSAVRTITFRQGCRKSCWLALTKGFIEARTMADLGRKYLIVMKRRHRVFCPLALILVVHNLY